MLRDRNKKVIDVALDFDESGAWWRIERHVEPRFSQKDDEGKITLDLCHFIK
jgi:hypothetical protein